MAINVTVLGASGTTVTIPFTTQATANAAQAALNVISGAVTATTLTQVNYTGGGTLPGATSAEIGVVDTSNSSVPLAPFAIGGNGGNFVSAVLGGSSSQAMLIGFGSNQTVVSGSGGSTISSGTTITGTGGAAIANLGTNSQVFFGGAASQSFSEVNFGGLAPSATVWVDNAFKGITSFQDDAGSTTIIVDSVAGAGSVTHPYGQIVAVTDNGTGASTINIKSSTDKTVLDGVELRFLGNSSVATTVNAASGADSANAVPFLTTLVNTGNAFINGNGSEVVMFSTGAATGVATLFGGTGTDIDAGVGGLIIGGSHTTTGAGPNIMFASSTQSTTLVGGGSGDFLVSLSKSQLMIAGTGAGNLFTAAADTLQGVGVTTVVGGQTLPTSQTSGGLTNMVAFSGGETFMTGSGNTSITAVQAGGGNVFIEGVGGKNTAGISGFLTGTDTISLKNPAGGTYTLTTGTPGAAQVELASTATSSTVTFGDGTSWTFNTVVKPGDFH